MNRFLIIIVLACLMASLLQGQNLVLNPNFNPDDCEVVSYRDSTPFQMKHSYPYWLKRRGSSLSRIHTRGPSNETGAHTAPDPCGLFDESMYDPSLDGVMSPVEEIDFASVVFYTSYFLGESTSLFRNLSGFLSDPLQKDSLYYFSAHYAQQYNRTHTSDQLQVVLSSDTTGHTDLYIQPEDFPGHHTIFRTDTGEYILNYGEWKQWEGCFQARGGERFLHFFGGALYEDPESLYEVPDSIYREFEPEYYNTNVIWDNSFVLWIDAVVIERLPSRIPPVSLTFCPYECRRLETGDLPDDPRFRNAEKAVWSDGIEGVERLFADTGSYVLSLHTSCGVIDVEFEILLVPCSSAPERYVQEFCASEPLLFDPEHLPDSLFRQGYEIHWADGQIGLDRQFSQAGIYDAWLQDECSSIPIEIEVKTVDCDYTLYFPNVFSPNGDGINDVWEYYAENVEVLKVQIFDRQGALVFESKQNNVFWNGRRGNREQTVPNGVYAFIFKYRDRRGQEKTEMGSITIVR